MKVIVKLFAAARDLAGRAELAVEVPSGAHVGQLRTAILARAPQLKPVVDRSLVAINAEYADNTITIGESDEIALIPPVSGG